MSTDRCRVRVEIGSLPRGKGGGVHLNFQLGYIFLLSEQSHSHDAVCLDMHVALPCMHYGGIVQYYLLNYFVFRP